MKKLLAILVTLLAILTLPVIFVVSSAPDSVEEPPMIFVRRGTYRFVDEEAGVVCWLYWGNGISCLPIGETRLE